jgi:hypothetical protein
VELGEMDGVAVLVDEAEIGDLVAGLGDVELDGWAVVGLGLADDDEVVDEDFIARRALRGWLRNQDIGGDKIAGVEFVEDAGVAELVGHGHRVHVAGDGLVVERDFAFGGIGGDDFAAQGVGLELFSGR